MSCDASIQLPQPKKCSDATESPAEIMCHSCWYYTSNETKIHVMPLNIFLELHNTMMPSTVLLASHDTNASTGISTGTNNYTILLINHFNMNAMMSLISPSASCNGKHVIAMYVPGTNMTLKCHIYKNTRNPLTAVPIASLTVLPNCPCFYR